MSVMEKVLDPAKTTADQGAVHGCACRYSDKDVEAVVAYAAERGVRVMVEIDTPGHTLSWGEGYPELLTECFNSEGNSTGERWPGLCLCSRLR